MRNLLAAVLLMIGNYCLAQCPFAVTLTNKGSVCFGKDTLVVNSANKLASIKWYKNGELDTTVNVVVSYAGTGITVAGGNGLGNNGNQIGEPEGVYLDKSGNIYVADYTYLRIEKFPPNSTQFSNGTIVAGGNGRGGASNQFNYPNSVCVDNVGNIYVADVANYRIQQFAFNSTSATNGVTVAGGNGMGSAANQFSPISVFVDGSGSIYVADINNSRIQKFLSGSTSATNGITVAGGNGQGNAANQFNSPNSVFVDGSGNIFVADAHNNRVQKFPPNATSTTNGITVAGGNGSGSAANQFQGPSSVYVDVLGNIYVADWANSRIQKFPPNSTSVTNGVTVAGGYGYGSAANKLSSPSSIFINSNGDIFVADENNIRIQKFPQFTNSTIDTTRIPTTPGTYYAILTDTSGCSVTSNSITINAPVTPTISITASGGAGACSASSKITFTASTTNGGTLPSFQWQVNGVNAGTNDSTFTSTFTNKDVVACTLTSNAVCAAAAIAVSNGYVVKIGAPLIATLQNKGSICLGKDTLAISSPNTLASIAWYNGTVLDTVLKAVATSNPNIIGTTIAGGNGEGNAANQFNALFGIYLDNGGNVYVADGNNQRIQRFPNGSTGATNGTTVAGGNGYSASGPPNQLFRPSSVFIDGNGYMYVGDQDNTGRIKKFPPGSTSGTNYTVVAGGNGLGNASNQLDNYCSVLVDGSGYLYVADVYNNRIQKFPPNSTPFTNGITVAGGNGAGAAANQLNYPTSVFVDGNGNVFVTDFLNYRIQKFAPGAVNGITVAGGNGTGSALNQFIAYSVSVNNGGEIYVADSKNNRILKFPSNSTSVTNGVIVAGGNGAGAGPNQLNAPNSVCVDGSGNIFVCDGANDRIQKFSAGTTTSTVIDTTLVPTTPGTYYAIITDTSGCSVTTNAITLYPTVTPTIGIATSVIPCTRLSDTLVFTATITNGGTAPHYQWQVNGANAGRDSAVFTAAFKDKDVVSCILTSNIVCATAPTDTSNSYTILFAAPVATLGRKHNICLNYDTLLVSSTSDISKIAWYNGNLLDTTIKAITSYATNGITVAGGNGSGLGANQFFDGRSVIVDGSGNIYVADWNNNRIQKFPPNSTSSTAGITVAGGNGSGKAANQLDHPYSICLDGAGNLYVADGNNNRIQKFAAGSTGATNGITVAGGNGAGSANNQFDIPTSVCQDASGNLYVADFNNHRVQKFPIGSSSSTFGTTVAGTNVQGQAANQLMFPSCVFVDGSGNLFVADAGNNRIQKFPQGSTSGINGTTVAGITGANNFGASTFSNPQGVFVDAAGNIYVSDYGYSRTMKFPPTSTSGTNGITVGGINGKGSGATQLNSPEGLFVDGTGNIYVADDLNERIQKYVVHAIIDTSYVPTAPGIYTALVINNAGCQVTSNAIVIGLPITPNVSITADKPSVCLGNTIVFTATPANASTTPLYVWEINGVPTGTHDAAYSDAALADGDAVTCIISNGVGCAVTDTSNSIIASIKPLPVLGPVSNISITLGQSTVLDIPVKGNIATYLWSPPTSLSSSIVAAPIANPLRTTTYVLQVTSVDSCSASASITVSVSSKIRIPSGFTPNGDGLNDVFYVLGGSDGDKLKDFSIFDRWGNKMFQVQNVLPNEISFGWNGTYNGTLQQAGTYVYIATVTSAAGTDQIYKGTVVLMR